MKYELKKKHISSSLPDEIGRSENGHRQKNDGDAESACHFVLCFTETNVPSNCRFSSAAEERETKFKL